jgi:hypothetical protein
VALVLFPASHGPFAAIQGPATSLWVITCDAVDFTLLDLSPLAQISPTFLNIFSPVWEPDIPGHAPSPLLTLRC